MRDPDKRQLLRRPAQGGLALAAALALVAPAVLASGCAPACQGAPTSMELDFTVAKSVDVSTVAKFSLAVTMGDGRTYTRIGDMTPAALSSGNASVVFEPGDLSVRPYTMAVAVQMLDASGTVLAQGMTTFSYQANGCNFISVPLS